MVHSLAYVSAAHPGLTRGDLQELQEQSRRHNSTAQITGLLLYRDQTFVQFLEGDEDDVEALFARIVTNQRNRDVTLVRRRQQTARHFPTWTTAFDRTDSNSTGKSPHRDATSPRTGLSTRDRCRFPRRAPRPLRPLTSSTTDLKGGANGTVGTSFATRRPYVGDTICS